MIDKPLRAILWVAVSTKKQAAEDKASLATQEADQRAIAERNGWQIIDVLRVPGHSRRYKDINKIAAVTLKKGIDAYAKLIKYFDSKSFDVLVVRDGSRFARTQALHSYITETTIEDVGARIYSLGDGWVEETNMRLWIAMSGFATGTEVDNLKKRHKFGMLRLLEIGKPVANFDTITHRKVRDAAGKSITYAPREDMRQAWHTIIEGLLASQSYNQIARLLHERGIPPPYGEAWYPKAIANSLLSPITWGHIARYYHRRYGIWAFDVAAELPSGVIINRNTHEPYWTGELAIQIQNELRRREQSMRGRAWPQTISEFSGLLYCGCCGQRMVYRDLKEKNWQAFSCPNRYNTRTQTYGDPCTCKKKSITVHKVREWLTSYLEQLLVDAPTVKRIISDDLLPGYEVELAKLGKALGGLYVQRNIVPIESAEFLEAEIKTHQAQVASLKASIERIQQDHAISKQQQEANAEALTALRQVTVPALWQQTPQRINQLLHGALAGWRLIVVDGDIVEAKPV